jgi:hypothetical protein
VEPFRALAVYEMARTFEQLKVACNFLERGGIAKFSGAEIDVRQVESIEFRTKRTRTDLAADWKTSSLSILRSVEIQCESIGLKLAAKAAGDYRSQLESGRIKTYSDISDAVGTLDKIITLELLDSLFMHVPSDRAIFYAQPELFGSAVNKRFPDFQYDIEEAGNCHASGRATACAFHLMRIMELALQELGTVLGIALTNEKDWQNILDGINKAIRKLPPKDARTISLSSAAGHLYNVKVAWRNPTMHPRITYTSEQAADLRRAVKAFLSEIVKVI